MKFDNYQSQESALTHSESATEAQEHVLSPVSDLVGIKKQYSITKTQSQVPLKTMNQLMVKDETCIADDVEVENVSASDARKIVSGKVGGIIKNELKVDAGFNNANDEDDYEDMVTPTDDEGITNLNHT